jgi:hypothetical protein
MLGMLFAHDRRTVTSWFRPAGITTDFRNGYTTVGACGRRSEPMAYTILKTVEPLVSGERLVVAIDDTPTPRLSFPHILQPPPQTHLQSSLGVSSSHARW